MKPFANPTENPMNTPPTSIAPILRLPEVMALTGRSRSSLYEDLAAKRLPPPIRLGPRAVGWLRTDIEQWQAERIAARDIEHGAPQV